MRPYHFGDEHGVARMYLVTPNLQGCNIHQRGREKSTSLVECFAPAHGISRMASRSSTLDRAISSLAVFGTPENLWKLQIRFPNWGSNQLGQQDRRRPTSAQPLGSGSLPEIARGFPFLKGHCSGECSSAQPLQWQN